MCDDSLRRHSRERPFATTRDRDRAAKHPKSRHGASACRQPSPGEGTGSTACRKSCARGSAASGRTDIQVRSTRHWPYRLARPDSPASGCAANERLWPAGTSSISRRNRGLSRESTTTRFARRRAEFSARWRFRLCDLPVRQLLQKARPADRTLLPRLPEGQRN